MPFNIVLKKYKIAVTLHPWIVLLVLNKQRECTFLESVIRPLFSLQSVFNKANVIETFLKSGICDVQIKCEANSIGVSATLDISLYQN